MFPCRGASGIMDSVSPDEVVREVLWLRVVERDLWSDNMLQNIVCLLLICSAVIAKMYNYVRLTLLPYISVPELLLLLACQNTVTTHALRPRINDVYYHHQSIATK